MTLFSVITPELSDQSANSFYGWPGDSIDFGTAEEPNFSSDDTGQYGKVYLSYTLKSNRNITTSGTWTGHGRGINSIMSLFISIEYIYLL